MDLDSGASNDNGLLLRSSGPKWVYNLSTRDLQPGSYEISILTSEGTAYRGAFVLK